MTRILPARGVVQATPRTRIITLDVRGDSFPFDAGQAVLAGLADGVVRRPYSIASSPGQATRNNAFDLLVQIDDHSAPDPHLDRVVPGTLVYVEGPFGAFTLPPSFPERRLLLVAGGTGIAPLRAIMWDTIERRPDVEIAVVYSARSAVEFAFLEELQTLAASGRITLDLTVTRAFDDAWTGARGRIGQELLLRALTTLETRCVVCGPPSLVSDATALLRASGVTVDRILTETYSA